MASSTFPGRTTLEEARNDALLEQFARYNSTGAGGEGTKGGSIVAVLNAFFSFLERRTDFFHTLPSRLTHQHQHHHENIGFEEGVAEKMVHEVFRRHQRMYRQKNQPHLLKSSHHKKEIPSSSSSSSSAITTPSGQLSTSSTASPPTLPPSPPSCSHPPAPSTSTPISTFNGGECAKDGWRWNQTFQEVTIEVDLFEKSTKSQVAVTIRPLYLKVCVKGVTRLEGQLEDRIDANDSTWSVEDGRRLMVTLWKSRETWWKSAVIGAPSIDVTKIESVKRIEDFDDTGQAALRKVLFDHNQTLQGLPTSDQMQQQQMLREAWDAEGSPFKGQPFDPRVIDPSFPPPPFSEGPPASTDHPAT